MLKSIIINVNKNSCRRIGNFRAPSVPHPLSSTQKVHSFAGPNPLVQHKNLPGSTFPSVPHTPQFNTKKPSVKHQKPFSSTHSSVQHQKTVSSATITHQFNTLLSSAHLSVQHTVCYIPLNSTHP